MLGAVAQSLAEAQPRGVAKYSGMGEAWLSEFAKYFASLSESEFLDLVEKVKREGARHFSVWRARLFCGGFCKWSVGLALVLVVLQLGPRASDLKSRT